MIIFDKFHNLDNPSDWDTDYNSDNWKSEIMTPRVTLNSICNTCDAFHMTRALILLLGCGFSKYMFQLCRDNVTKVALCTMQNPFYNQCSYFNKRLQQMMIWLWGRWEVNEDETDKAILPILNYNYDQGDWKEWKTKPSSVVNIKPTQIQ